MTQELTQATNIINEAKSLIVQNEKQAIVATEVLSRANKALDLLTEKEDERTKRIKEELAFIRAPYIEPKRTLKEIIADLRTKLGTYQTEKAQIAAKEAQGIADKAEAGRLKPSTAVRRLEEIVQPTAKLTGESGSLTFRPKPVLLITDMDKIPRDYLVPAEEDILAALKDGKSVPGCEIQIIQVPINRRA